VNSWFGLAAPAGTPREVVARLNQALNASTSDPKVREALESRGATVVQHTPQDMTAFVKNEVAKWGPVVKRAGVVPD
jgi:tripartite-type tricarboxylate transporter receptor subunit TctC